MKTRERDILSPLYRLLLGVFFREVELRGAEHIPREGAVVIAANHVNGLVDPALVMGYLPRRVRFLAKSTLWQIPLLRPFLALGNVIPLYRRQDDGADPRKNREAFDQCYEALRAGQAIAVFPEGVSHNEPALQPLRTGVARIALGAEARYGPLGLRVIPVGLTFDAKARFRSRALVCVGEPIDPEPERALFARDERAAIRALMERIASALESVTLNYRSFEEARLLERAADVVAAPQLDAPTPAALGERFSLRRDFAASLEKLRRLAPSEVARVARMLERYDALLERLALRDEHVAARYPRRVLLSYLGTRLPLLALWVPVSAVGIALNWIPYRIPGLVAERFGKSPDLIATLKVLTAFVLLPFTWIGEAVAVGAWLGTGPGLAMLVLAPASGYAALVFHERHQRFWREVRAYLTLRLRRGRAAELRARRRGIHTAVTALLDAHRDAL